MRIHTHIHGVHSLLNHLHSPVSSSWCCDVDGATCKGWQGQGERRPQSGCNEIQFLTLRLCAIFPYLYLCLILCFILYLNILMTVGLLSQALIKEFYF